MCTSPAVGAIGIVACTWPGGTTAGVSRSVQVIASSATVGAASVGASTTSTTPDPVDASNAGVQIVQIEAAAGVTSTVSVPALGQCGLWLGGLLLGLPGAASVRHRQA